MIDDFFIGKLGYIYQIPENKWCIPGSYFHKISLKVIKQNHKNHSNVCALMILLYLTNSMC